MEVELSRLKEALLILTPHGNSEDTPQETLFRSLSDSFEVEILSKRSDLSYLLGHLFWHYSIPPFDRF